MKSISEVREPFTFEAPAVFWRSLGAAACAVVNKYNVVPRDEPFLGEIFTTWSSEWKDLRGQTTTLQVRECNNGEPGPSSLSGIDFTEGRLLVYRKYIFDVVPETQSDIHRMMSFAHEYSGDIKRDEQALMPAFEEAIDLGLVASNKDDAFELYTRIMLAPYGRR